MRNRCEKPHYLCSDGKEAHGSSNHEKSIATASSPPGREIKAEEDRGEEREIKSRRREGEDCFFSAPSDQKKKPNLVNGGARFLKLLMRFVPLPGRFARDESLGGPEARRRRGRGSPPRRGRAWDGRGRLEGAAARVLTIH